MRRRPARGRSYREAREEIATGRLRSLYLFHGAEVRLQEDLLLSLRQACLQPGLEAFNYLLLDGEAAVPREVGGHLETAPVLGGRRLVVVRDLPWLQATRAGDDSADEPEPAGPGDDLEEGWLAVARRAGEAGEAPGVLVFTLRQPADGRRRLYREIASRGGVVDCSPLPPADVVRWLRRKAREGGKELGPETAEALVSMVGTDLNWLWQELAKVIAYAGEDRALTLDHLRAVASRGTSWGVFDLTDAVAERRGEAALAITRDLLAGGESPVRLIALLGRQVRLLLAARDLGEQAAGPEQVAAELAVPRWVAGHYLRQAASFRPGELEQALEATVETDLAVKSGRCEGGLAVELLVASLGRQPPGKHGPPNGAVRFGSL